MQNVVRTSDRVDVIRCRDCRFAHMTYSGEVKYCDNISMPDDDGGYMDSLYLPGDFYCAFAEPKEDHT